MHVYSVIFHFFFFQAEDGIRYRSPSRGLGDVYKRQAYLGITMFARQIATIFSSPISSIIMIGVVFGFVYLFGKRVYQNPAQAFGMLMGFAVLNGLMFTVIGMVTPIGTLATAFLTTAFLFAGMALYGVTTKKSMASMSSILFGSLIALIIGGIINLFFFNSIVYMFLSVVGVIVFALFTAYDMNRLKAMYMQFAGDADMEQGMAVSGALSLYMDFINLFIYMIQLFTAFGGSRD